MSTKFFISFVAFNVNVIGDLFYITPLYTNRQYLFINIFKLIFLCSLSYIQPYKDSLPETIFCFSLIYSPKTYSSHFEL
ncbi:hypothetical protein ETJ91_30480 [Bacillus albus]|nr:hypothetical protein ETJ91_30480 [Bacillus albus]RXJ21545.1 hypothetical protein ETJ90_30440 [Bacillus albus]RXJ22796.1 hypothetical protein ETJ76_30585 [Bacillus albus]RXJ33807.1 hypothetical protein ETJ89_30515 [Bacillus albus]RXJ50320.1 hypothetical protein ETJ66_30405 [Bacillus albus]